MRTGKYPRTALLILTLLISIGSMTAQVIKGTTVGEDGKEIPYVGIALRSMPDSTLIGGTYSDERGLFELSIKGDSPHGADLILVASAIGYRPYSRPITPSDVSIRVVLTEETQELAEVVLSGSRITRSSGGYVAQIQDDVITKGVNVDKTLTFLPGITRSPTGYLLNGLPIAQFYIEDRKASLQQLEAMPASMIKSIEVSFIDRVGTERTGSVVRVRLKSPEEGGYYGFLTGNADMRGSRFGGISARSTLNLRKGKTELYASIGGSYYPDCNRQRDDTDREDGSYLHTLTTQHGGSLAILPEINVNYNFTDEHRVGVVLSGGYGQATIRSTDENSSSDPAYTFDASTSGDDRRINLQGRLKYSYTPKSGIADLETWGEVYSRDRKMSKAYSAPDHIGDAEEGQHRRTTSWEMAATSSQRWSDHLSTDIGLVWRGSQEMIDSHATLHQAQEGSTEAVIHSPYLMVGLSYDIGRLSLSGRLSYQGSFLTFRDRLSSVTSRNKNQGLEPNLRVSYYLDSSRESEVALAYRRGVYTYDYGMINTTKVWTDRHHYYMGNPSVKAPIDNDITLSGNYRSIVNGWISYSIQQYPVTTGTFRDPVTPEVTYTTPVNGETERWWQVGLQLSHRILPEWQARLNASGGIGRERGIMYDGEELNVLSKRLLLYLIQIVTLPRDWSLYASLAWEPTYRTYNEEYLGVSDLTVSVSKSIGSSAEISLMGSYGHMRKHKTYLPHAVQTYHNLIPQPYVSLSFRWGFNNGKKVNVRREYTTQRYQEWTPR